jgi:methylenetetrahydrofolate dehydrogenase (NADP+)/methenyltetrahydrofolate cyclohydrolase
MIGYSNAREQRRVSGNVAEKVETASDGVLRPSTGKALIIDGKRVSELVLAETAEKVRTLAASGLKPGLAVVLAGDDPASHVYVKAKGKAAESCGFYSVQHNLPAAVSELEVLKLVEELNSDPSIHGILVQLPLPKGIDSARVLNAISPAKDVDGFHPVNVGLLGVGETEKALVPCTPAGSMVLIERAAAALGFEVSGCNALVLGRSNIVGKPMAQLLLAQNATVTIAHSKSRDLPGLVGKADLLVAAVGRPNMVPGSWIKEGALVIDVGINRIPGEGVDAAGKPKTRLVGDVNYEEALARAGAITPVPGGVGPMTIAMLMANTLKAALRIPRRANPLTDDTFGGA